MLGGKLLIFKIWLVFFKAIQPFSPLGPGIFTPLLLDCASFSPGSVAHAVAFGVDYCSHDVLCLLASSLEFIIAFLFGADLWFTLWERLCLTRLDVRTLDVGRSWFLLGFACGLLLSYVDWGFARPLLA